MALSAETRQKLKEMAQWCRDEAEQKRAEAYRAPIDSLVRREAQAEATGLSRAGLHLLQVARGRYG